MALPAKKTRASKPSPTEHSPASGARVPSLRLYWIAFNVALEPDVRELLDRLQMTAYTWWDEIKGAGHSGPHLNDEVWPAVNGLFMLAAPAEVEAALAEGIVHIRKLFPGEGIKLIVQPCSAIY
jgi:hypothetical protein